MFFMIPILRYFMDNLCTEVWVMHTSKALEHSGPGHPVLNMFFYDTNSALFYGQFVLRCMGCAYFQSVGNILDLVVILFTISYQAANGFLIYGINGSNHGTYDYIIWLPIICCASVRWNGIKKKRRQLCTQMPWTNQSTCFNPHVSNVFWSPKISIINTLSFPQKK